MLALTIDLLLAAAAWSAVAFLWLKRRAFRPATIWDKLAAGATLIALVLTIRLADSLWTQLPWPLLADPLVQEIAVTIGLLGGVLAVLAGLVEWIPEFVAERRTARWLSRWAAVQTQLQRRLRSEEDADNVVRMLLSEISKLCDTSAVFYFAFAQRAQRFVPWQRLGAGVAAEWTDLLQRVESTRLPELRHVAGGPTVAIPLAVDRRMYGALIVRPDPLHPSLHHAALLGEVAARCALALHGVVRRAQSARLAATARSEAEMQRLLGARDEPADELLAMLDIVLRELGVEYAACLGLDGEGSYARRYARLRAASALTERGLEVVLGKTASDLFSRQRSGDEADQVRTAGYTLVPYASLRHRLALPLFRGESLIGVVVVASATRTLGALALDRLGKFRPVLTTALERVNAQIRLRHLEHRLVTLGKLAARPRDAELSFDRLTAEMLDEIPGTFCQYMRVSENGQTLYVQYRRARRHGWGHETTGMALELDALPTCRMVIENGRSVLFRGDDPERQYEPEEAQRLFGAVPQSVLLVPVIQDGVCRALLAVGEMREPKRHTFDVDDRRFADSFVRLAGPPDAVGTAERPAVALDALGDLNFAFASPLTGILGSVEILKQGCTGADPQNKYLDVIARNANRIRQVVTELAELQRTPTGAYVG